MCLGLASGYQKPEKEMTPEKALEWVKDFEKSIKEEQAIVKNGDKFYDEALRVCEVIKKLFKDNKKLLSDVKSLENKLIVLENQNSILSRNADAAFQDGLNEARDLYKTEVRDEIEAEVIKEFVKKSHSMITEIYNKYVFNGYDDLSSEEIDAVINFSDDVTNGFNKLVKERVGEVSENT